MIFILITLLVGSIIAAVHYAEIIAHKLGEPYGTLVLPVFTISSPGPTFTVSQLAFAGVSSLVLYGAFIFFQTVSHRDYFCPISLISRQIQKRTLSPPAGIKQFRALFYFLLL